MNSSGLQTLESMSQAYWYNQWSVSKFRKFLTGEILEVGCGIGNFTEKLSSFGKVYAIDINKKYIRNRSKFPNTVKVGYGDIEKGRYFFQRKKFNCIVCLNVLEHIGNDIRALCNMRSLVDKTGSLVLLVPIHMFLYNGIDKKLGHFRRYGKRDLLKKLEKAGFAVVGSRRINFLGAVGWFIAGKLFKNNFISQKNIKIFNFLAPLFLRLENFVEPPVGTSLLVIARIKVKRRS